MRQRWRLRIASVHTGSRYCIFSDFKCLEESVLLSSFWSKGKLVFRHAGVHPAGKMPIVFELTCLHFDDLKRGRRM